jgi:uncharacterized protein (DUF4415 family)
MQNGGRIVRYTEQELDDMIARGENQTDWTRVDAMTEKELEASIDWEEEGDADWDTLQAGLPGPKEQLDVLLDVDVIEFFKAQGAGYETRMNAVLRSYMEAKQGKSA